MKALRKGDQNTGFLGTLVSLFRPVAGALALIAGGIAALKFSIPTPGEARTPSGEKIPETVEEAMALPEGKRAQIISEITPPFGKLPEQGGMGGTIPNQFFGEAADELEKLKINTEDLNITTPLAKDEVETLKDGLIDLNNETSRLIGEDGTFSTLDKKILITLSSFDTLIEKVGKFGEAIQSFLDFTNSQTAKFASSSFKGMAIASTGPVGIASLGVSAIKSVAQKVFSR